MKLKKNYKKMLIFSLLLVALFIMNTDFAYASGTFKSGFNSAFTKLFDEYKVHIAGFIGFGIMTSLLAFVINFIRLGEHAGNPTMRTHIIKELIAVGICTALLASVTTVMGILYLTVGGK